MRASRRDFLRSSVSAGTMLAFGAGFTHVAPGPRASAAQAASGKKLLILGGTGFLGPAVVEAAKTRGMTITLFNRGKTRPHLFPELEKLHGDRDPNKGDGLKALADRRWDTVIDTSAYYPRMVKASAELLAPNVKHYIIISSISAYADSKTVNADETAPLATMADPTLETMGPQFEYYGALKALCEQAAEKSMLGRVTVVRPGFIVGPDDPTDRFTYWPVRVDRGGEVLAPGTPSDPIQFIDVRDLAEWLALLVENNTTGVFNACGPDRKLGMGELLAACRDAGSATDVRFTWVDHEFLEQQAASGDAELPIWVAPVGDNKGFHTWSFARAAKAGLKFRPVSATVKDTLAWFKSQPAERQAKLKAGPSAAREAEILAAWHKRAGAASRDKQAAGGG